MEFVGSLRNQRRAFGVLLLFGFLYFLASISLQDEVNNEPVIIAPKAVDAGTRKESSLLYSSSHTVDRAVVSSNNKVEVRELSVFEGRERSGKVCPIKNGKWREALTRFESTQKRFIEGDPNTKAIVWVCDAKHICGGFGDRVRGLVTTFLIALVTDRAFFIDSVSPEPLANYFQFETKDRTITWDWRVFNSTNRRMIGHRSIVEETVVDLVYTEEPRYLAENLKETVKEDIWIIRTNLQLHEAIMFNPHYKNLLIDNFQLNVSHIDDKPEDPQNRRNNFEGGAILSGCVINYILSPTLRLRTLVDDLKKRLHHSEGKTSSERMIVIGIQVRVGDAGWESKGSLQQDLFDDSKFSYFWKCASFIESHVVSTRRQLNLPEPNFKWFLTCDSSALVQQAQKQFGLKVYEIFLSCCTPLANNLSLSLC